uniref:YKT6 v-SNARE homolog n=2 Tax=Passeriformes TaxID=9126 RepID=A0A8C0ZDP7_CYACU
MRLYSLSVLYKGDPKVHLLKAAYDVSTFNFFQRSSVQEFMTFTSQLIAERSALGSRASVKEQEYLCHVYVRNDGLAGVVIADNEYPQRVCFTLLDKVLDEFSRQVSRMDWPSGSPATISYSALDGYLSKYQNPRDADPMTRVQAELDETKIILHNTMESLLERGEKLDDLVSKSEVLGAQSKAFYKTVGVAGQPLLEGAGDGWNVILGGSPPMDECWGTALGPREESALLPEALGLERAWVLQFQLKSPPDPHWGCPAPCHGWEVMPIPIPGTRSGQKERSVQVISLCAMLASSGRRGAVWDPRTLGELYRCLSFSS